MLRAILFAAAIFAGLPVAAETVTVLSTQSWVEPDEGEPFLRVTTPDWTAEMRGTEDLDMGMIVLAPTDGRWRHERQFELNAEMLPYVIRIDTVLHCDTEVVVVTSKVNFNGPEPAILYDRMLFDTETGAFLGTAVDTISQNVGGDLPAAAVIGELFPDC